MGGYPGERTPSILRVTPLTRFRLRLELGSGSVLVLNMKDRLHSIRFCPLAEPEVFASVTTDGETLFFGRAVELTAREAMELAIIPPPQCRIPEEGDAP